VGLLRKREIPYHQILCTETDSIWSCKKKVKTKNEVGSKVEDGVKVKLDDGGGWEGSGG
jgi:hypothetical protein